MKTQNYSIEGSLLNSECTIGVVRKFHLRQATCLSSSNYRRCTNSVEVAKNVLLTRSVSPSVSRCRLEDMLSSVPRRLQIVC
jgi:hypothetical protein